LALAALMNLYNPVEIRSQANDFSAKYPDHSDHIATGKLAAAARNEYESNELENKVSIPLSLYMGYPVHDLPPNVSGADLAKKEQTFFAYSHYDGGGCLSMQACSTHSAYGIYLQRMYRQQTSSAQTSGF